jgi:hypothetical protein
MKNAATPTAITDPTRLDLEQLRQIPGWFTPTDQLLFAWFLEWQSLHNISGDLVEMGVYKGKSAVLMGAHVKHDERLIVCDLFGRAASEEDIGAAASKFYRDNLCRQDFEINYLAFHDTLPCIVEGPSSTILSHVNPGTARFVHIDAAHRYANVRQDIAATRTMLRRDGVVVLDDYRTAHTPGVGAAVWRAVLHDALVPICVSETKFYGTWGPAGQIQQDLSAWISAQTLTYDVHEIEDLSLIRIATPKN